MNRMSPGQPVLSIVMPFDGPDDLAVALAALTVIDMHEIRKHGLPALYRSGVRYRREACLAPGIRETCERFLSSRMLLAERFGDCDDLGTYRAAELILHGEKSARAIPIRSSVGWHIVVKRADGSIEDPSAKMGMRIR